jgi:biopolymer transport protein ExbB/TolQ
MILLMKWRKLAYQRRALEYAVTPNDADFVLSAANVDHVIDRIYDIADDPKNFALYNRIVVALANLKNLGRVGDVDEILRSQAEGDDAAVETSYGIVSGFVWAIPVLGFIGTVQGLSDAIGGFGAVLDTAKDVKQITDNLRGVTAGLTKAFVTTLVALVAALAIQLLLTFLKKSEQEFLDDCSAYCTNQIVNRLRIMPFETADRLE